LTAHNSFVLIFSELGLVGYFVWLAFIGLSVYMGYKIAVTRADQIGALGNDIEAEWSRYTKISLTYLYAMLGFFVAAFFLSRSYVISLYILCALLVALYQTVRQRWPQFAPIALRQIAGWTFVFEIGSIAFIYVLVKVLLALGK
jgi:O-antigen ligase